MKRKYNGWKRRFPRRVIEVQIRREDHRLPDDVYPKGWIERAKELDERQAKE